MEQQAPRDGDVPVIVQDARGVQYAGGAMMPPTGGMARTSGSTSGTGGNRGAMVRGSMHGGRLEPDCLPARRLAFMRAGETWVVAEHRRAQLEFFKAHAEAAATVRSGKE